MILTNFWLHIVARLLLKYKPLEINVITDTKQKRTVSCSRIFGHTTAMYQSIKYIRKKTISKINRVELPLRWQNAAADSERFD